MPPKPQPRRLVGASAGRIAPIGMYNAAGPVAESLSTKIMHKKSALKRCLEADFCHCCTKTVYSRLFVRQARCSLEGAAAREFGALPQTPAGAIAPAPLHLSSLLLRVSTAAAPAFSAGALLAWRRCGVRLLGLRPKLRQGHYTPTPPHFYSALWQSQHGLYHAIAPGQPILQRFLHRDIRHQRASLIPRHKLKILGGIPHRNGAIG